MVFKTIDGDTIKFNVFLLILGFSRTKFLYVTESRDLKTVEECLVRAFKYIGGVPHEILFDNMRSIIDKARTQYNDPVFSVIYKGSRLNLITILIPSFVRQQASRR